MPEISSNKYIDIKFTRDTKVNYKNGNAFINHIFKKYDTDLSGDFNDDEWKIYQQDRKNNNRCNLLTSLYEVKLEGLNIKYKELEEKFSELDMSDWDELLEFENEHPEVSRVGIEENESIPEGMLEYDLSSFEMGIYDEKKDCFTGECYKKGYIKGLSSLSDEDKKHYLELLTKSAEISTKIQSLEKEFEELREKELRYTGLKDMSRCGKIQNVILNEKEEDEIYNKYIQIRNESNPFYKEIQTLEIRREKLRLKGHITNEERSEIANLNLRIQQLETASLQWSIADIDNTKTNLNDVNSEDNSVNTILISKEISKNSNLSNSITLQDSNISNATSIGFNISNEKLTLNSNGTLTQTFDTSKKEINISGTATADVNYIVNKINVNSKTGVSYQKSMNQYTQNLGIKYKNLEAFVDENIIYTKDDNESGTTYTTQVGISYKAGEVSNSAKVKFAKEGKTYEFSSTIPFNKKFGEHYTLNITPDLTATYIDKTKEYTLSPNISLESTYQLKNGKIGLLVTEQYSTTASKGNKPNTNHNLTATLPINWHSWKIIPKFNDSDSREQHSNTYGIEIKYATSKIGTLGLESAWKKNKGKNPMSSSDEKSISFKYSHNF